MSRTPKVRQRKALSAEAPASTRDDVDDREEVQKLFVAIRGALPELELLLSECSTGWGYDDPVYRFYHGSYKVYGLQATTLRIVSALQQIAPDLPLNERFTQIVTDGTGMTFEPEHNRRWAEVTRPIVEAFFHARYFLEMVVRYGKELEYPPLSLPSGWASVLYLFNLR